jgi:hypothetical protein
MNKISKYFIKGNIKMKQLIKNELGYWEIWENGQIIGMYKTKEEAEENL